MLGSIDAGHLIITFCVLSRLERDWDLLFDLIHLNIRILERFLAKTLSCRCPLGRLLNRRFGLFNFAFG
jgi:hypothetical protein